MEIRAHIANAERRIEDKYVSVAKVAAVVGLGLCWLSTNVAEPASTWVAVSGFLGLLTAGVSWDRALVGTCYRCGEAHRKPYRYCPGCGIRDPVGAEEETHPREDAHASESE